MNLPSTTGSAFSSLFLATFGLASSGMAFPQTVSVSDARPGGGAAPAVPSGCVDSIADQAGPGCLQASSEPAPGLLFPPPHDGGEGNFASGDQAFVGGGWFNSAPGNMSVVCGGQNNFAGNWWSNVGGGVQNLAAGDYATVAGGGANRAAGDLFGGATVSGGTFNEALGDYSTVSGGRSNRATGLWATVGGGDYGTAGGSVSVVSGGLFNRADGNASAVAGGGVNQAPGDYATIGGGLQNQAGGAYSTIPGGRHNLASGFGSFAAGRRARATHNGSFVWGDGVDANKSSSQVNEFNVYASGGTRIFSDVAGTTGVELAPGAGSWSSVSDRAAKENIRPVDSSEVLEKLRQIPISTWNYRQQQSSIRHMGPMAGDFRAAFGLGISDTRIDTIDPDGVALAAIQGLAGQVDELRERCADRDAEIERLLARVEQLERERAASER